MSVLVKNDVLNNLEMLDEVVVELGCGSRKRNDEWIGVDSRDFECVDIVGDARDALKKLPVNSVDKITSFHFFEHIEDLDGLLNQVARVIKSGGDLQVTVPHFSNPYFYSDHTHKNFFGLYTFSYLADDSVFKRKVPVYSGETAFRLISVDLVFKSCPPFYFRHAIKKMIGYVFNSNGYMKELYEENFCNLFPCYEIKYELEVK